MTDSSQVGAARRGAVAVAAALGFNETARGKVALIVTEVANNLVNHASKGELLLREIEADGVDGVEILAIDKGPGMASVNQCLRDGYSTAGTAGNGLGAIARLSSHLDIYSVPPAGTVLLSQLFEHPPADKPPVTPIEIGVINRPKPGQEVCGDAWAVKSLHDRHLFFVVDGLGHGPEAADASRAAVQAFYKQTSRRPKEIIEAVHTALHGSRGAAAAITEIDLSNRGVCFAGIGNISATIASPNHSQSMVSHNGIVGHRMHRVQEFTYSWPADAVLVMHSDGLSNRWTLDQYPGLQRRRPALMAGVLYRDFQREIDDATVLVASELHEGS
jgi:anti-sigma regulatory factor (Ser/Thr protein kinase)